ncbi:MAG: hypothetical protein COW00_15505 [Bdellovibrio sp. CG12_big_fil_rev_8_21_14_0_65_39_13]|nr:MAG: hypothetical protein COW78_07630 [Bdellovibrio sp. CG22_combo_CG10-13_8_21_14_all_39_27]PIQ58523.1 MAG: hypothetical protein COW00_15505 [Bdellovibrio sp. CG12_big_fil_rev_8_21_14_0_65_39_13]PIR35475.1 MAG: hypothetical protein COV37_08325 [Bdellovibrio sp. CG11_big_fil_rev_8_21_14_0_20_39_38]
MEGRFLKFLVLSFLLSFNLWASPSIPIIQFSDFTPKIRVKLADKLKRFFISGMDLSRKLFLNNESKNFNGLKAIRFNCDGLVKDKFRIEKNVLLAKIESPTGFLNFEKDRFRGSMNVTLGADGKSCELINETHMEDYISSLLSKEMNAAWPLEALKAQAVAARTYAMYKIKSQQVSKETGHDVFYDLESSEKHQVSGGLYDTTDKTDLAARETEGEILVGLDGSVTPIFFHAMCGGTTLRPDQVWSHPVKGYDNVPCPTCAARKNHLWNRKVTISRFAAFLDWAVENGHLDQKISQLKNKKIKVLDNKGPKTYVRIYLDDKIVILKKVLFRKFFGRVEIPSNNFYVVFDGKNFLMNGNGNGHGVGMCQIGAHDLAKKGWDYRKILKHYLPGFEIRKVY